MKRACNRHLIITFDFSNFETRLSFDKFSEAYFNEGFREISYTTFLIMRPAAVAMLLVVAMPASHATICGEPTVTDLLERCKGLEKPHAAENATSVSASPADDAYCIGHFDGFRKTIALSIQLHRKAGFDGDWKAVMQICIPGRQASSSSLARIFTHWAKANAIRGDEPAVNGIYDALRQAYPCVDTYR